MKKVLIVTYYWPPVNSAGVYSWLKFVKYLRDFDVEPVVFTIERPATELSADQHQDIPDGVEVIKRPIFDPFEIYQAARGKKKAAQPGFLKEKEGSDLIRKWLFWLRGNFFIPDAKKFWVKPSVRFLTKYLQDNQIDAIVTTGPPHSMHLIGMYLKRKTGLRWIADFRDPWTKIDFYKRLGLTGFADRKHKRLEMKVASEADELVTVSHSWKKDMEEMFGRKVNLVHNGFDEADFAGRVSIKAQVFTIAQVGSMNEDRNPTALWQAIKDLMADGKLNAENFQLKLIGPVDHKVVASYTEYGLDAIIRQTPLVPHDDAIQAMMDAHLLLLPINTAGSIPGIIPGKLYEYLRSGTPILSIGATDGDSANIIRESNGGYVVDANDVKGAANAILYEIDQPVQHKATGIDRYRRQALTGKIVALLNASFSA